jgi:hypothetical protein
MSNELKEIALNAIRKAQAEIDKRHVFYNRETGEVFDTREAAIADANEQYDFGDETNYITYLGFPNNVLPYIEIEWGTLKKLQAAF